jgi:cobalt/nickel transport system permease protein
MHHAYIDKFAYQDSIIHRLDSRVKFIVAVVFTAMVVSLSRTSFSIVVCYAVGPFAILVLAKIPLRFAFKQILLVSPFIVVLGLSFPFYDRAEIHISFGTFSWQMSRGWLRCFVIIGKFTATMLALIALVSTTRFSDLLAGLQQLGVPKILTVQLGFLYRYIFVLIDKAHHILRARTSRTLRNLGFKRELKVASAMLGSLLIRSIDTAEHINIAMQARGFSGRWRSISRLSVGLSDFIFALTATAFMFGLYFFVRPIL